MKRISLVFIIVFFVLLLIPVIFFDFRENIISEIDNRKLTNNPINDKSYANNGDSFTDALENYVSDRIGFRNYFIRSYTSLNDKLFDKMVHPIYEYGKDDYVFFVRTTGNKQDVDEFYDDFLNMLVKIKEYCDDKNVPFFVVFEPSKSSVLTDKINSGINYDNNWVNVFLKRISDNGINLVDNYAFLKQKYNSGEKVFNQKYDAGHWNDLGAFYGVNNLLEAMKQYFPQIHVNEISDFNKIDLVYKTLPVSEFSIYEKGFEYNPKVKIDDITDLFKDKIKINPNHPYFKYWVNNYQKNKSPKTLVFQGSYMNGYGYRFLQNSLSEYIAIHNYENILDFSYYFSKFEPECVVFEVTEYTLSGKYFNKEKLKNFDVYKK